MNILHECDCALMHAVFKMLYNTDIITIIYYVIDTPSSKKYHQEYGIKNDIIV